MNNRGATLVEYAILLALVATVCLLAVAILGYRVADANCRAAGMISDLERPVTYSSKYRCCGYDVESGFGGAFLCID